MLPHRSVPILILGWLVLPGLARGEDAPVRAENVIIFTLDGLRPEEFFGGADDALLDAKAGGVPDVEALKQRFGQGDAEARREALLPFLWGTVARKGQVFGDRTRGAPAVLTNGLKFSYPGYNEMFCGYGDPRVNSNAKTPNPNRSVLEFLNEQPSCRDRVAAFCTWDVLPYIFRSAQNGLKVHAGWEPIVDEPLSDRQALTNLWMERLPRYWPGNVFDAVMLEAAREHLIQHKPRVLYIGLGETDEWAHGRRYDLYLQSAHAADRYLGELWQTLQAMPEYRDKTALVVTTDHGRGRTPEDWTSHGQQIEGAEYVWIAVMGPDTPALGVRENTESTLAQVAATVAQLIGEDFVASSPKSAPPLPDIGPTGTSSPAR